MTDVTGYRYHPMEDRRIRVRQWLSADEAIQFIRNSYDGDYPATRTASLRDSPVYEPVIPPVLYPTKPVLTAGALQVGVPTGTILTAMTPAQVNLLAPGVVVQDKWISGTMIPTGTTTRVFQNCLLEGTATENVLETVNGALTVKTANAPNYALSTATTGTPVSLQNCEVRNASKLLLLPGGGAINKCYIHDGGEDGIHMSVLWANLAITDTIIGRCGNLRYHSKVGWTTAMMHADLIQLRGQSAGVSLTMTRVVFDGQDANAPGGPVGGGWGTINACIIAQAADGPIYDVHLTDCWLASGGNWEVYMADKGQGQVVNYTLSGCEFAETSTSGPLSTHGASGTAVVSGNIGKDSQASIDATLIAGTGW